MRPGRAFVFDLLEILSPLAVRERAMFGSYGLYCDGKFVGIVSEGQLYLKPTVADQALFEGTEPAPPFDGATDWHLVPEDMLWDTDWLRTVVQATADALPLPAPKKRTRR
jgi:TfoX/Sxy family transcriptional regulator of competence genes